MGRVEPKLPFPKETRVSTTSIHNAVNPQYTKYQQSRMSTGFITGRIEQHLDRAHKVTIQHSLQRINTAHEGATQYSHEGAMQYSPRRSYTVQPTREQYNAAHEGATQHSPRRSTTKTGYTPDCLKTKINQQEPLGFGRAELKARRREED